jgi:cysteine synthase A
MLDLIGNTPIIKLNNYLEEENLEANIFAKVESFNPAGSVKDRVAKAIILDGLEKGTINKDTVILEPTSGNTGVGLAAVGAALGLKVKVIMPESMSIERRKLAFAYGAEVVLSEASKGMQGAVDKAEELKKENPNSIIAGQFDNPVNPTAHYKTTGPEIYNALDGMVDFFVAGIGTGGTISGTGKYLKEKNKNVKIIAVEPSSSPLLSKGKAGGHKIQGIGANFIPKVLNTDIYDEIVTIENEDAYDTTRKVAREEGLLVGISSGAALKAATIIASRPENKGKNIVVLLPDTGERYLSTDLF